MFHVADSLVSHSLNDLVGLLRGTPFGDSFGARFSFSKSSAAVPDLGNE